MNSCKNTNRYSKLFIKTDMEQGEKPGEKVTVMPA